MTPILQLAGPCRQAATEAAAEDAASDVPGSEAAAEDDVEPPHAARPNATTAARQSANNFFFFPSIGTGKYRCVPYFSLCFIVLKLYHKKRRENNSRMLLNSRLNIVYFCISIQQSGRNSLQCQPRRAYNGSSARYSPILSSPAAITSGVLA